MRNNCITVKSGKLNAPKEVVEFILGGRHSSDQVNLNTEKNLIYNITEYIFIHIPYLKNKIYIDLPATFTLFRSTSPEEGYNGWEVGIPKILVGWINYYAKTRLVDFDLQNSDHIKKMYWWMIEDIISNKNVVYEDLMYVLFHSDKSLFYNNNFFQLESYLNFYEYKIESNKVDKYFIYTLSYLKNKKTGQLFLDYDTSLNKIIDSNPLVFNVQLHGIDYKINASYRDIANISNMNFVKLEFSDDKIDLVINNDFLSELIINVNLFGIDFLHSIFITPIFTASNPSIFAAEVFKILEPTDLVHIKKIYGIYLPVKEAENLNFNYPEKINSNSNCVIGRFTSSSGVGEDARMFNKALSVISGNVASIDTECFNSSYATSSNFYNISICCMPPWDYLTERLRYPSIGQDCNLFVGYWPWEMQNIPYGHEFIYDDFDMIFVPSKFVADCFSKYTKKPIKILTAPVAIDGSQNYYKKNNEQFTYLVMFDCSSSIHRKNPFSAVATFIRLYGNNNNYFLIIKTMNASIDNSYFKELVLLVEDFKNIKVINSLLSMQAIYSLISNSDCYISTHRSEGFGRIIAESMLLRTPTIVSNWSGNVDFCFSHTSYLVDGNLVPVKSYEYGFSLDQHWFEADLDSLAFAMQNVSEKNDEIINNAFNFINTYYSVSSISNKLKDALSEYL